MPATLPFGRWLHKARWVDTAAWKYAQAFHEQARQVAFPAESASGQGIIRWQDWPPCFGGDIAHWEPGPRGMLCRRATLAPASRLITTVYHDAFSCSIREITSLESGKGGLTTSATLDAYALSECCGLINSDPAWIEKLLGWHELRFNAAPGAGETLESFSWHDRGYHLLNQGGAHHFAAARYLAGFYAPRFCINAPLARYSINHEAAQDILNAYDMFCEPEDQAMLEAFTHRMAAAGVPHATCPAPPPWDGEYRLLLLSRESRKAAGAASVLRQHGWFDVSALLRSHVTP